MVAVASVLALAATAMAAAPVGKYFDNYIFIVMENEDAINVLRNSEYASLLKSGVEFTDYHGTVHPSQPNYWSTIAQSTFRGLKQGNYSINGKTVGAEITGDNGDNMYDIDGSKMIADSLEAAGLSWGIYSENYPGNSTVCYTDDGSGTGPLITFEGVNSTSVGAKNREYKRKHNPFMSFTSINQNVDRCTKHVFSEKDWAAAVKADSFPDYVYFVPNQVDDSHDWPGDAAPIVANDPTPMAGIDYSAQWLAKFLVDLNNSAYLNSRRTLVHITFDENDIAYSLHYSKIGAVNSTCLDLVNNCPGDKTNNQ
ncbi:hypothetical protein HDU79_010311, partial [Rhizoclosmatium sp. JEL0117]